MNKETKRLVVIAIIIIFAVFVSLPFLVKCDNSKGYSAAEPTTEKPVDILETTLVSMSEEETTECLSAEATTTEEEPLQSNTQVMSEQEQPLPEKRPLVATEQMTSETTTEVTTQEEVIFTEATTTTAIPTEQVVETTTTAPIATEEDVDILTEPTATDTDASEQGTYLGCYITTAYYWTGNPCADMVYPELGYTVACNDPALWHRWVYIDGVGARYVHDRGGMSSYAHLDIYLGDRDSCINWGRRDLDVWLME